jgi:hypothetical protein
MHPTLRIVVVVVLAVTVVASAIFATVVRTYRVQPLLESVYAIWDDEQLVVFAYSVNMGTSQTVLDGLQSTARKFLHWSSRWPGPERFAGVATVACFEDGAVRRTVQVSLNESPPLERLTRPPRFVEGRPLIIGGFWNGTAIERVAPKEYIEMIEARTPDEPGRWHSGSLLPRTGTSELTVSLRGQAMTVRATRSASSVSIDLVRPAAAPTRLVDLPLGARAVSEREFNRSLRVLPD